MVRRQGDEDMTNYEHHRTGQQSQLNSWAKFIVSGLVAGLVAWGAMQSRQAAVETRVTSLAEALAHAESRASEDRSQLRQSTDRLAEEIGKLREEIASERLQRLLDRTDTAPSHGTFPKGKYFDK